MAALIVLLVGAGCIYGGVLLARHALRTGHILLITASISGIVVGMFLIGFSLLLAFLLTADLKGM